VLPLSVLLIAFLPAAEAEKSVIPITVSAGKYDRVNELVCVPLTTGDRVTGGSLYDDKGKLVAPVAVLMPSLQTKTIKPAGKGVRRDVYFVLPRLEAGKTAKFEIRLDGSDGWKGKPTLAWLSEGGDYVILQRGGPCDSKATPVLRYEMPKLDDSTPAAREKTYKPFHHVYLDGKLLTKGPGGKFTHHRGLFYGFKTVSYDKDKVDIWHCLKDTHQAHHEIVDSSRANPVLGRQRVLIDWNGTGKKTFATEERELTAVPMPNGLLIDFTSRLTPTGGQVKLDGDPQHAGFHFRASDEVASKTTKETYFVRPDGVGEKNKETNWPANKKHVNLPYLGMSCVIGGQRYTIGYIDHTSNPKEARFSERTYGRFGSYFVTTVTKEKPLLVRYRVWVQKGEMKPEQLAALSDRFLHPVEVKVGAAK
jgi:hypothetical protein